MILDKISETNFINGQWVRSKSTMPVMNPSTSQVITSVPIIEGSDVLRAIDYACVAQKLWKQTLASHRSKLLLKLYDLIIEYSDELAQIITLENGKVLPDAKGEILYGANFIKWFADAAQKIEKSIVDGTKLGQKIVTDYEPVGVVAAITPWNFPNAMITRKIAPALAAGCCVILKPSELTPLSALAIAYLVQKAGFPDGVINIITGDSALIGKILCDDFRIRKLSFTGSTNIGKLLYQNSANTLKRISLELGGNAPFIVHKDANFKLALDSLFAGKMRSSSQACTSPNRVFIHSSIYDKFVDEAVKRCKQIKVGVDIGPLINQSAVDKALRLIDGAVSNGAILMCGGKVNVGTFLEPSVIKGCIDSMEIFREEIFAPVIPCYKYENIDEVIARANDTEYGLASYIFSTDKNVIDKFTYELDFGIVGVNSGVVSNYKGAFAGRKNSGFGVEGSHLGIYEYLNTKYLCIED